MKVRLSESSEWRTVILILFCYAALAFVLLNPINLPIAVQVILLVPLITLHSSLQHECIHGHPFKSQLLNNTLVFAPIGIFLPYLQFKSAHIKHHQNSCLAVPYEDPESCYQDPDEWANRPKLIQKIFIINNTLAGRMLIGPAINLTRFAFYEFRNADLSSCINWVFHLISCALILEAVNYWSNLPVWVYFVCCYFGYSLLMVRTFLEHQAHTSLRARSVIIEDTGFFSYLFLNNNLHALHHAYPAVAWYRLPKLFRKNRQKLLALNEGYYFKSYWEIFKLYAFSAKEPVAFPTFQDENKLGLSAHE
ncbi:hypothetical protein A9Q83_05490 [Alphaproteobacteria bacterium 46_93_T64]|nr:hypothetical protein A9Q83_05490 [Alphaproteobacteria bacterium 46_93_T64]